MPQSPDIVLAVLGALFLLVGVAGRIESEKLKIGLSTAPSRLLAAVLGVVCMALSVYLYFYRDRQQEPPHDPADDTKTVTPPARGTEAGSRREPEANRRPVVDGEWNVTIEGPREIVWHMKVSLAGDQFSARGPKLLIDGQPAQPGERETNLVLQGKLSERVVKGRYSENQPTRETSGDFQLEFSADGTKFSGTLSAPKRNVISRMSGVKIKG